jgi:hypothetical protein
LLLGWNEGRVLPSYGIFQTSWVQPTPHACQPKNTAAKTPLRRILGFGVAADEVENRSQVTSVVLYFVWVRISPYKPTIVKNRPGRSMGKSSFVICILPAPIAHATRSDKRPPNRMVMSSLKTRVLRELTVVLVFLLVFLF